MASVPTQPILIPSNSRIEYAMDLDSLGFLVNEVKSDFEPHQFWDHLGFTLDLFKRGIQHVITENGKFVLLIGEILDSSNSIVARVVSRLTGTLISMELALGPVTRLRTRSLYADLSLSRKAIEELRFWRGNFSHVW